MSKGPVAFFVVTALVLSMSMLSGLGFYGQLGVSYEDSGRDDVSAAADALVGQEASDKSGGSVLQDFTTSAGRTISTGWQLIANTDGIIILLFGIPAAVATPIQILFNMTYGFFFAAFIRGVVVQ